MRIFIYEFITGGGTWSLTEGRPPSPSLLAEGQAMAAAVTADFAQVAGVEVCTTRDSRVPPFHDPRCFVEVIRSVDEERAILCQLATETDWTLLIAPEFDGILLARCEWVLKAGGKLLSPGPDVIRLASDKHATAEHLARCGVRVPRGCIVQPGTQPPESLFPAVLKPLDGCGSLGVRLLANAAEFGQTTFDRTMRMEEFISGPPVSVAVLCGPQGQWPLAPCQQHLSSDGRFTYLGGQLPLPRALLERAIRLALAAAKSLTNPVGYLGIDLVLGDNPVGHDDTVIEINPRLTTSYVGLRALARENLAAAMLAVARGERPALSWRQAGVQFTADGRLCDLSPLSADLSP